MPAHDWLSPLPRIICALSLPAVPAALAAGRINAHGSAGQVYVTGLRARVRAVLLDAQGHVVARQRADAQGGLLFTRVRPGAGYRVRLERPR